jgi:hypothetical protein
MSKNIATFEEFCKMGVSPLVKKHYSGATTKAEDLSDPKDAFKKGKNAKMNESLNNRCSFEDMNEYLSNIEFDDFGLDNGRIKDLGFIQFPIEIKIKPSTLEVVKHSLANDSYPGGGPLIFKGGFKGLYKGPEGEKLSENVELVRCYSKPGAHISISISYYVITEGDSALNQSTYIFYTSKFSKKIGD